MEENKQTNAYQRISSSVMKMDNYLVNNYRQLMNKVFNWAIIFICMAVLGCFNFVDFSMDFKALGTSKYWIHVGVRTVCLILLYNVGINWFKDKEKENNETLKKEEKEYKSKNKLRDNNFEYFINNVLNKRIKKDT